MAVLDRKNIVLPIDQAFVERCAELDLANRFLSLRGADLIYACAATLEVATAVTFDKALRPVDGLDVFLKAAT